jgi:hypothetical protein
MPHEVPGRVPDPVPTLSMQLCGAVQGKGSDSHSSDRQQQDSVQACTVQARGTSFQGQDHVAGPLPPGSSISDGRGIAIGMIRGVPARNGALRQGSLLDTARWMGIFATLCCCMPQHGGAVEILMFVPVYEWVPVWKDWRNSDYKMGSIWRPKMIEHFNRTDFPGEMNRRVDGYDIREYATFDFDVVYFGDVFMKGHGVLLLLPLVLSVLLVRILLSCMDGNLEQLNKRSPNTWMRTIFSPTSRIISDLIIVVSALAREEIHSLGCVAHARYEMF